MTGIKTVYCACGKTNMVVPDGMTVTNLRCTHCPPETPKPDLRLVVETLHLDGCTLPGDHEGPCNV